MSITRPTNVIPMPARAAPAVDPLSILAVIPAFNEEKHIEACIRSLMTGKQDLQRVSIVVADGGSTDNTVEIVIRLMTEFPNLRYLHNEKRLQSAAINLAVETFRDTERSILVRCDAHSIYPENFILRVADALIRYETASLVVPMDAIGSACFQRAVAWIADTPLGSGGSAHRGGVVSGYVDHGHHAAFVMDWFDKTGGYDEAFSHNEDAEYDARLKAAGGNIWLDASIRILYKPRGTVRSLARQYYLYGKGRAKTAHKHRAGLRLRQFLPLLVFCACVTGLLAAPFFPASLLLPLGYGVVLAITSLVTAVRFQSLCGLGAGLAAGTMHMSWAAGFIRQTVHEWFRPQN